VQTAAIEREVRRCLVIIEAGGKIVNFPKVEQFAPYRPERSRRTSEHAAGTGG